MLPKKKAKIDKKDKSSKPMILEAGKADRGDRPNTCRGCVGSKFC